MTLMNYGNYTILFGYLLFQLCNASQNCSHVLNRQLRKCVPLEVFLPVSNPSINSRAMDAYFICNLWRHTLAELPIQDMGVVLTHIADLEKQLGEQKRMIAVIHESHIMQSIPLKRRLDMAVQHLNTYSLKQLCRVFEVRPSSLYYHIAATQKETKYQQKGKLLRSEITRAFEDSGR